MKKIKIVVNDKMQQGYEYLLTEKAGENFHVDFKPELTPQKMLEMGVFGGKYMTDCRNEYPKSWYKKAKLSIEKKDISLNFFGVDGSQPLRIWQEKEWIHPDDPRGWFQWYCRYYMGRRHDDDERQIKRWKAMKRHLAQIKKHCFSGDLQCRKKQRQALLHWAYNSAMI